MCKVHIILSLVITTNPKAKENLYPRAYQAAVTVTVCAASRPFNVLAGAFQNAFFVGGLYNVIVTLGSFFFTFGSYVEIINANAVLDVFRLLTLRWATDSLEVYKFVYSKPATKINIRLLQSPIFISSSP
jgi:hypothetical protein